MLVNLRTRQQEKLAMRQFILMMTFLEQPFIKAVGRELKAQYQAVGNKIQNDINNYQGIINITVKSRSGRMIDIIEKYTKRAAEAFGKIILNDDTAKSFMMYQRKSPIDEFWAEMDRWLWLHAAEDVVNIDNTTMLRMRRIIDKGMRNSDSVYQITKRLFDQGLVEEKWRGRRIARTETHTAAVKSTQKMAESVAQMNKSWRDTGDERTRISHIDAGMRYGSEDKAIPMNEKYMVLNADGGVDMMDYPGDPSASASNRVNCRCIELYYTVQKRIELWRRSLVWQKNTYRLSLSQTA